MTTPLKTPTSPSNSLIPAADVVETDDGAVIHIDLPGVERDRVELELKDGLLTVNATYETSSREEGETRLLEEFSAARYFRSFRLGDALDVQRADATFENGVLEVRIPRREESAPKRIEIRGAE